MKTNQNLKVTKIIKKVSGQGNTYYEVDAIEDLGIEDGQGSTIKREWKKMYFKDDTNLINVFSTENEYCNVILNFYPMDRKVGDKIYQDIKVNIVSIAVI